MCWNIAKALILHVAASIRFAWSVNSATRRITVLCSSSISMIERPSTLVSSKMASLNLRASGVCGRLWGSGAGRRLFARPGGSRLRGDKERWPRGGRIVSRFTP